MARASRLPVVLTAMGAFWALRRASSGVYESKVVEKVMVYRDTMFSVGTNCEITLKSGDLGEGDATADLELLWKEFALPIVRKAWSDGKYALVDVTSAVMDRMFPEEQCTWPPTEASPQSQKGAFYLMMALIAHKMGCGFEGAEMLGSEEVCMTEEITLEQGKALTSSAIVLGMMAPGLGGVKGLKVDGGTVTVSYRAPAYAAQEAEA